MIAMATMKSKYGGRDIVPVLIIGGLYGMIFALIIRETVCNWKRAETAELITQALRIGSECARKERANGKKEEKVQQKESGTKGRRHHAKKKS